MYLEIREDFQVAQLQRDIDQLASGWLTGKCCSMQGNVQFYTWVI